MTNNGLRSQTPSLFKPHQLFFPSPSHFQVITAGVAAVAFVSAATFVRSSQAAKKRKKEDEGKARRASATLKLRFVAWVQTAVAAEEYHALDKLEVHLDTEKVELDVLEAKTRETTHRAEKNEKWLATSHAEETRALMEDVRLGGILQGRLEEQLEAERDVREIRKKRFKGYVAAAKERAKTAELTLATISGLLKIEQVMGRTITSTHVPDTILHGVESYFFFTLILFDQLKCQCFYTCL